MSRKIAKRRKKILWDRVLIFLGALMLCFWALHAFLSSRALQLSRQQAATIVRTHPQQLPVPTHIFIPWNSNVAIEPMTIRNGVWGVSDTSATYLVGSARPGESGNIIVYGHNTREILGNIRALKGGESITIHTSDNRDHMYIVTRIEEVSPDDVTLLGPTTSEVLTLYTCAGLLDSQRFIVRARPQ